MAALLPPGKVQFADANGHPYALGTIDTYIVNTSTPKTTWTNAGKSASNTNPITLDSAGRAIIYGDGSYRFVLKDHDGNTIWDQPTSSLVSDAMAPVILAPTIADAVVLLGTQDAIDAAIATEATARIAGDAANSTALGVEISVRGTAVTDLQTALTTEANTRIAADAAEAVLRAAGDANLQSQIDSGTALPPGSVTQTGSSVSNGSGDISVTFPVPYAGNIASFTVSSASLRLSTASLAFDGPPVTLCTGQLWQDVGLQDPGHTALTTAFDWTAVGW